MNTGIVKRIMVLAVLVGLSGCSSIGLQQAGVSYDRPILSAAEAQSIIRASVKPLEPIAAEQTVATLTD